jgi:protease-4
MEIDPELLQPHPPQVPARTGPSLKWVILVLVAIIAVICVLAVVIYVTNENQMGVKVVRMEGTLVTGDVSDTDSIGSEVVGTELRDAADDPMVEAIVLRVNSPGGSPAAAEEIIGDLEYAKTKKPVVVSMGDMATSAAYYVSVHADKIYADPDSFTGGIGVIWTFSDISRWMNTEGYNVTIVKSGDMKDMGSASHALTDEERAYAQQVVNESFNEFINDVTTQRAIARSDIEDGRVFRGADALKINLVDQLGNLNDAIDGAKQLAAARH